MQGDRYGIGMERWVVNVNANSIANNSKCVKLRV